MSSTLKFLLLKAIHGYKKIAPHSKKKLKPRVSKESFNIQAPSHLPQKIEIEESVIGRVRKLEPEKVEGIDLGKLKEFRIIETEEKFYEPTKINVKYPLIPRNPKQGQKVFAYAHIRWSQKDYSLVYYVIEPKLTPREKSILEKVKKIIMERLDIEFESLKRKEAKEYLEKRFMEIIREVTPYLPKDKQEDIFYYIQRDFLGLEKIEPLMQDPNIEDISCDGVGIPIYVNHRDPKIGTIKTNIVFESAEELDRFVNKLAQRCGKMISIAQPLLDATLPDGSRLQATLGTDIARRGSNFTIRKFTEEPLTPAMLIKYGTLDSKLMAYLWFLIEHRRSMLIGGGTATGKTTMLNALSLFIPPDAKIVTIEDTAELRLPHPHWVPHVARKPITEFGGKKIGEVDMFDLLVESLRQRPDYIIVGEVRGKEAYVLFQEMATGHAGIATIHADTIEKLIDRLTTPPIALPGSLIEILDSVLFLSRIKRRNSYIRRVTGIHEIAGYDKKHEAPVINTLFEWDAMRDIFVAKSKSVALKKIAAQLGYSEEEIHSDIATKIKILDWAVEKNYTHYKIFSYMIKMYYLNKERLLQIIEGE